MNTAAVSQHAQSPDLFLGPLLGELSVALDKGRSPSSKRTCYMAVIVIMELHPMNLSGQTLVIHKQSDAGVDMCLSFA